MTIDNFELHRRATILADTESAYQLAKRVVKLEQEIEEARGEIREYVDYCSGETLG